MRNKGEINDWLFVISNRIRKTEALLFGQSVEVMLGAGPVPTPLTESRLAPAAPDVVPDWRAVGPCSGTDLNLRIPSLLLSGHVDLDPSACLRDALMVARGT